MSKNDKILSNDYHYVVDAFFIVPTKKGDMSFRMEMRHFTCSCFNDVVDTIKSIDYPPHKIVIHYIN